MANAPLTVSIAVSLALVALLTVWRAAPAAADSGGWSTPTKLEKTSDTILEPEVVADRTGAVHVFWIDRPASPTSGQPNARMIYAVKGANGWSAPTDVIDMSGASAPSAVVDEQGTISLFWHQVSGDLFRSETNVSGADRAAAWALPTDLGPTNDSSTVVADSKGRLNLVYPGIGSSGILYQRSDDGGRTWSYPVTIASAASGTTAEYARAAVGPDGTIHVVWTEFQLPNGWPPVGVYYSRSTDSGNTWSVPLQIAQQGFTQANVAAGPAGKVFVAWNGMSGVQGRYSRWSADDGRTWSAASFLQPPAPAMTVGGSTGTPGLVVDSAGNAHVLFVQDNRVWYAAWNGKSWSTPTYVASGDESGLPPPTEGINGQVRHIEQAVMTIGLGNQLHVVFWDERPKSNVTYVWYTSKQVDAPAIAPRAFAVAAPTSTADVATPTAAVEVTTSSVAAEPADSPLAPLSSAASAVQTPAPIPPDPRLLLTLVLAPIALGIGGVVALRVWMARR